MAKSKMNKTFTRQTKKVGKSESKKQGFVTQPKTVSHAQQIANTRRSAGPNENFNFTNFKSPNLS